MQNQDVSIRNRDNSQLTRVKERILIPYLKSLPYLNQRYPNANIYDRKCQALSIAFAEFIQFQSRLKGALFQPSKELQLNVKTNMLNFSANLMAYSSLDFFEKSKSELMDHNLLQSGEALLTQVQNLLINVQGNIANKYQYYDYDVRDGNIIFQSEYIVRQRITRSKKCKINFKNMIIFLIFMSICIYDASNCSQMNPASLTHHQRELQQITECVKQCYQSRIWRFLTLTKPSSQTNQKPTGIQQKNITTYQQEQQKKQINLRNNTNQSRPQTIISQSYKSIVAIITLSLLLMGLCIFVIVSSFRKIKNQDSTYPI